MSTSTDPGSPGQQSSPREQVSRGRLLWRSFAYLMLCAICVVTAALLLSSGRYGVLAPLIQLLLACAWAAFAWHNWKQVRARES